MIEMPFKVSEGVHNFLSQEIIVVP